MGNKHIQKLCQVVFMVWAAVGIIGCLSSQRDNPVDPLNQPAVIADQAVFNPQDGRVTVTWQYVGRPLSRYRVVRRNFHTFLSNSTDWIWLSEVSGDPLTGHADVQPDQIYVDPLRVFGGEAYIYLIEAGDAAALSQSTFVAEVQIPGARFEDIALQVRNASTRISLFHPVPAASFEILRQANDESPIVVFQSEDASVTEFVDTELKGNTLYRYSVKSYLSTGLALESQGLRRAFYLKKSAWSVPLLADDRFWLATSDGFFGALTLIANPSRALVRGFSPSGLPSPELLLPFVDASQLDLQSVSFLMAAGGANIGYVAGINKETQDVQLVSFVFLGPTQRPWVYDAWTVDVPNARTVMATDRQRNLFVVAGDELRVFNSSLRTLGTFSLGLSSSISSLTVNDNGLWAVLGDEHRVIRSSYVVSEDESLQAPVWQNVVLPDGARPVAVLKDPAFEMLILDAENQKVMVFDGQGSLITTWADVGHLTHGAGMLNPGISKPTVGDAYIWDSSGQVTSYEAEHASRSIIYLEGDEDL